MRSIISPSFALKASFCTLALVLTACATNSTPKSNEELAVARSAFDSAERAGGRQYAPLQIQAAESKINRAQTAINQANYEEAARLAQQAEVDAQLAEASAQSAKAEKAAQELEAANQTLRQEISNRGNQ